MGLNSSKLTSKDRIEDKQEQESIIREKQDVLQQKQKQEKEQKVIESLSKKFPSLDAAVLSSRIPLFKVKQPGEWIIREDYAFYVSGVDYKEVEKNKSLSKIGITEKAVIVKLNIYNHKQDAMPFSFPLLYLIDQEMNEYSENKFYSQVSEKMGGLATSSEMAAESEAKSFTIFGVKYSSDAILLRYKCPSGEEEFLSLAL